MRMLHKVSCSITVSHLKLAPNWIFPIFSITTEMSRLPTASLNENFAWLNWNIPPKKKKFSWHLIKTVGQHILNKLYIYRAGFLKTLPRNRPLPCNSFLSAKKNYFQYKKPLLFFSPLLLSSSSLFLFLLSFSFASLIFGLIGRKKPAF